MFEVGALTSQSPLSDISTQFCADCLLMSSLVFFKRARRKQKKIRLSPCCVLAWLCFFNFSLRLPRSIASRGYLRDRLVLTESSNNGEIGLRCRITVGTLLKGGELLRASRSAKHSLNTLRSLSRLSDVERVIVFLEHGSNCSAIPDEFKNSIQCVSLGVDCMNVEFQRPTMGCVLRQLKGLSQTDTVMYVNGDIVLFQSMVLAIRLIEHSFHRFVLVGKRYDVDFDVSVVRNAEENFMAALEKKTLTRGKLHGVHGLDYFVMKRADIPLDLPEFVTGAWKWDNTLLVMLLMRGVPIIDGSDFVTALHQGVHTKASGNHEWRVGATHNSQMAFLKLRNAYTAGRTDVSDYHIAVTHDSLRIMPSSLRHRYQFLTKCLLRKTSVLRQLLIVSMSLRNSKSDQVWASQAQKLATDNYVIISADEETVISLSKRGINACHTGEATESSNEFTLLPAKILLEISYLGYEMLVISEATFFATHLVGHDFSAPRTLGVSITNFGSAGAVYLSDSGHARKFLTRVNACQCSYLHGIKVYFNLRRRCTSAEEQCRKRFNGQALECFTNSLSRL